MSQEGFSYKFDPSACATCGGRCCTGESGYIYVNKNEIIAIAEFLEMQLNEFGREYLFKKGYKYSLKERKVQDQYECIFYDATKNMCTIYEVRPQQCRTFPFWDYFKTHKEELQQECPGVIDV